MKKYAGGEKVRGKKTSGKSVKRKKKMIFLLNFFDEILKVEEKSFIIGEVRFLFLPFFLQKRIYRANGLCLEFPLLSFQFGENLLVVSCAPFPLPFS